MCSPGDSVWAANKPNCPAAGWSWSAAIGVTLTFRQGSWSRPGLRAPYWLLSSTGTRLSHRYWAIKLTSRRPKAFGWAVMLRRFAGAMPPLESCSNNKARCEAAGRPPTAVEDKEAWERNRSCGVTAARIVRLGPPHLEGFSPFALQL